jgi:hypothetical protein
MFIEPFGENQLGRVILVIAQEGTTKSVTVRHEIEG